MGLDKISARMLKDCVFYYANNHENFQHVCFHRYGSWELEIFAYSTSGQVCDSSNPGNYRPISLLLIVSKLLEKHVHDLLCERIHISGQQWGIQACKSMTNAILSATNEWLIHLEAGLEVQAVFFDLY